MIAALSTSATGLDAAQALLDVTSHNLANLNTTGFKARQVSFQEVSATTAGTPQAGAGVAVSGVSESPAAGSSGPLGGSNVNPATELVNLLIAKHFHAANVKAAGVADQMAAAAVGLVR